MTQATVAVIGLGSMGFGMAQSCLRAGLSTLGADVNDAAVARFRDLGGQAGTPGDAAPGLTAVLVVVLNAAQMESVLFGPDGVVARLSPGAVVIACPTVAPDVARNAAARCEAHGVHYLDAPISGGAARAAEGALSVMASGRPEAFAAARPVLDAIARDVFELGDAAGAGSAMKATNQMLAGVHIAAMGEALAFGMSQGIAPETFLSVIRQCAGTSWMLENRAPHVVAGDYTPLSQINIWPKDLGIVLDIARGAGFSAPITAAAMQQYMVAVGMGLGAEDDAAITKVYARNAGLKLPGAGGGVMGTVLGCIADDFTGATDLAGLLARSGQPVSLRIGVPEGPPRDPAPFEVIALKCRTAPVAEAVAECRAALHWLLAAGAGRFYWKYCSTFDSTPQGNIGPVAEALMDDLGTAQTIYCPAFPENGRAIFMGNLFVGRQPLAESPMKDHPLTPMRDSNLMRLLAPQVTRGVGLVDRLTVAQGPDAVGRALAELAAQGIAHVVVDAVADSDLAVIAMACRDAPLLTGGSALALSLPALYEAEGALAPRDSAPVHEVPPGGAVILSGSCSAMTRAQVAAYSAHAPHFRLDPLALADAGPGAALGWLAAQPEGGAPMIFASADPDDVRAAQARLGVARAGALVEQALAALALAARDRGVRRFVVAGGETSGAVTQALCITRLDIGAEIAPGVPWTFAETNGVPIALTLKSGNFGAENFFADALAKLER